MINFYTQKLDHIDQYLLACGWQRAGNFVRIDTPHDVAMPHFTVPAGMSQRYAGQTFSRADAIAIQVRFDEMRQVVAAEEAVLEVT